MLYHHKITTATTSKFHMNGRINCNCLFSTSVQLQFIKLLILFQCIHTVHATHFKRPALKVITATCCTTEKSLLLQSKKNRSNNIINKQLDQNQDSRIILGDLVEMLRGGASEVVDDDDRVLVFETEEGNERKN